MLKIATDLEVSTTLLTAAALRVELSDEKLAWRQFGFKPTEDFYPKNKEDFRKGFCRDEDRQCLQPFVPQQKAPTRHFP